MALELAVVLRKMLSEGREKNAALQAEVENLKRKLDTMTQLLLETQAGAEQADPGDASPTKRRRGCAGLMAL